MATLCDVGWKSKSLVSLVWYILYLAAGFTSSKQTSLDYRVRVEHVNNSEEIYPPSVCCVDKRGLVTVSWLCVCGGTVDRKTSAH